MAENLAYRTRVYEAAAKSSELRRALTHVCESDILFWVNTFVWQYNPNHKTQAIAPFLTWPFQEKALRRIQAAIELRHDLVLEKSREMGASWLCLLAFDHQMLFHPYKKFLVISRNADAVDRDDPDSLFWKLDFVHRHLPGWLLPKLDRKAMVYKNLDNGSTITGQATTGKAGVGGRATAMFIDEFAQIDEAQEVWDRTADTTGCRIVNSTHTGVGTVFHKLCDNPLVPKLRMHWSDHPEKNLGLYQYDGERHELRLLDEHYEFPPDYPFVLDGKLRSPWYDDTTKTRTPRAIACDLDIDPKGAASQFFDAERIRQLIAHYGRRPLHVGDISHDGTGHEPHFTPNPKGALSLWLNLDGRGKPPKGRYVVGADIATGTGATPTCFSVVNALTGEKVAEWADAHASVDEAALAVVALVKLFSSNRGEDAQLCWETQGPGVRFGIKVLDLGLRNIYWKTGEESQRNPKPTKTPGWYPHPRGKRLLLENYRQALYERQFVNPSALALDETLAYEYTTRGTIEHGGAVRENDPSGARENHGDRVVADALAWKLVTLVGVVGNPVPDKPPEEIPVLSLAWRRQNRHLYQGRNSTAHPLGWWRGRRT